MSHADGDLRLPLRVEAELYRIAQEALTNVRRHAQATDVTITLRERDAARLAARPRRRAGVRCDGGRMRGGTDCSVCASGRACSGGRLRIEGGRGGARRSRVHRAAPASDEPAMIRVFVVDDHPIVRQGLVDVLEDEPDFAVVGAAGAPRRRWRRSRALHPDVVLLDLELAGVDGVAAIPRIAAASPETRVLVFTAYDTDERVFGALEAGARGYLLKGAPTEEIARAIRAVHAGGSHLEPRVAARDWSRRRAPRRRGAGGLSEREHEVLRLSPTGLANKEIGRALAISERTVRFHVTSIFNKLGATSRAQAVALATQRHVARHVGATPSRLDSCAYLRIGSTNRDFVGSYERLTTPNDLACAVRPF